MLLTKTNTDRNGIRKHTLDRPVRMGQVSVRFVMIGLLAAVALLYLAQSTQGAARSYQIQALEKERQKLDHERDRLEIEAIRLQSLPEIEKAFPTTPSPEDGTVSWEAVHQVEYLDGVASLAARP